MRSFGASRSEVAIDVSPEEMQRSVCAAGIDVEVLEVVAHDELTCVWKKMRSAMPTVSFCDWDHHRQYKLNIPWTNSRELLGRQG